MKDLQEVLRQKAADLRQARIEVESLRTVISLLAGNESGMDVLRTGEGEIVVRLELRPLTGQARRQQDSHKPTHASTIKAARSMRL